jgi:SNF2 family DNA or RNA helicase
MYEEERALYECAFTEAQDSITQVIRESVSLHRRNMYMLECLLRMRQIMRWPQLYFDGVAKSNEQIPEIWKHSTHKMSRLFQELASHPTEKSVIFCTFKGELDYIERQLACPTFRIELFENAPDNSVMVTQIKCGGVGLNIQCATRVYIMAPSWNPATELQAIGRCHRSGQKNDVFVKKLVYKDTPIARSVELAMMSLQGHKSILCADVLNDKRVENQIPIRQEKTMDAIRKIFRA